MKKTTEPAQGFQFCSDQARQEDLPLIGTAPFSRAWFLLEYNGHWEAKAKDHNNIPPQVLKLLGSPAHQAKLLFIRQDKDIRSEIMNIALKGIDQFIF